MDYLEKLKIKPYSYKLYQDIIALYEVANNVSINIIPGIGKNYISLLLALHFSNLQTLYLSPLKENNKNIKKIIRDNNEISFKNDLPNLDFKTYNWFIELDNKEIENLKVDFLIIEELSYNYLAWQEKIDFLLKSHPNLKVFSMSYYEENGNLNYSFKDALNDQAFLPFTYHAIYDEVDKSLKSLEDVVILSKINASKKIKYLELLNAAKSKNILSYNDFIRNKINIHGKYYYFCPYKNINDKNYLHVIKEKIISDFSLINEDDIIFYNSSSVMNKDDYENLNLFINDNSNKLKIMLYFNKYSDAYYAPVNGVILDSDLASFEVEIARALSLKINNLEIIDLNNHYDKLKNICKDNLNIVNIDIYETINYIKDSLFFHWDDYYKIAKKYYQAKQNLDIEETFKTFDGINFDKYGVNIGKWLKAQINSYQEGLLDSKKEKLLKDIGLDFTSECFGWQNYYELLTKFYNYYGNTKVPEEFITSNGISISSEGKQLGKWLIEQNIKYQNHILEEEKINKLKILNYNFKSQKNTWEDNYLLLKKYYEYYLNTILPINFKTIDGINYDENGKNLYEWLCYQKKSYNRGTLDTQKYQLLKEINVNFKSLKSWDEAYKYAQEFYLKYKHLEVPEDYINREGFSLGNWISRQRTAYNQGKLSSKQISYLNKIGMRFAYLNKYSWEKSYNLAKDYYEKHHKNIPVKYTLEDGYKLGMWYAYQKQLVRLHKLSKDKESLLNLIGIKIK